MEDFAALRAKAETAANSARHQLQAATNSSSSSSTSSQSRAPLANAASYAPRSSDAPVRPPLAGAPPSSSAKKYGSTASTTRDSAHDKRALFSALDEFFSARLGIALEPLEPAHDVYESSTREVEPPSSSEGPVARAPKPKPTPPPRSLKPPPPISRSTRPVSPAHHSLAPRSYPPAETHSSASLSLLHWLLDPPDLSRQLNNNPESDPPFFLPPPASQNPLPPVLAGRNDVRSSFSWRQRGEEKTYGASFLFGDGSVAWIRLSWHASSERRGTVTRDVEREGRYRPRPDIERDWDGDRLYAASETYGPRIVRFARAAVRGGRPIARGECWDLANEALKACEDEMPATRRPMPSIARTHGALIYYANATRSTGGQVLGEWTGRDLYVRPGDIVEWRSVKIREVGMGPGSYSTLGDPEHTALIVSAGSPISPPALPASGGPPYLDPAYPLSSLVSLTVVEQSLGSAPSEKTYDLAAMSAGEVWIYRPCALRELCGIEELGPRWPDEVGVQSWELGELE